jgi:hypothetical protein
LLAIAVEHKSYISINMVKIINGEIVQDNDPRVKNLQSAPSSGSTTNGRRGGFQDMSSLRQRQQQPGQGGVPMQGGQPRQGGQSGPGAAPVAASGPLDSLATAMGISDKFITIPAIPTLGMSSTRVGLVYFILLGVMYLIFDYRALLFAVIIYGMYKHQGEQ